MQTSIKASRRCETFKRIMDAMCPTPRTIYREVEMRNSVTLTVEPSPACFGAVLGKGAANLHALELLFKIAVEKENGKEGRMVITTPDERDNSRRQFVRNPNFGAAQLTPLLRELADLVFDGGTIECQDVTSDTTVVEMLIDAKESLPFTDDQVQDAFRVVFNSICKANGREVRLDLARNFHGERPAIRA